MYAPGATSLYGNSDTWSRSRTPTYDTVSAEFQGMPFCTDTLNWCERAGSMSHAGDSPTDGWMNVRGSAGHAVSHCCRLSELKERASHVQ